MTPDNLDALLRFMDSEEPNLSGGSPWLAYFGLVRRLVEQVRTFEDYYGSMLKDAEVRYKDQERQIQARFDSVVATEREACAVLAEDPYKLDLNGMDSAADPSEVGCAIADAIRRRG